MRKLLFVCLFVSSFVVRAASAPAGSDKPSFELDAVPLADFVRLVYVQAFPSVPYFTDPQILQDRRPVSFRYRATDGEFRPFFLLFLRSMGYSLESKNKADIIKLLPAQSQLATVDDPSLEIFIYRPKFRDSAYLVDLVSSLFLGKFSSQKKMNLDAPKVPAGSAPVVASPGSLLDLANKKNDVVIFSGVPKEVVALKKLLTQLDVDSGQVVVSAALYEVQTSDHEASAIQLAAQLFNGVFQINVGAASLADNFISFKNSSVNLIMQALNTDSRFKVLSSPSLRVSSGATASLTVGQDVPVLGAVTYPPGASAPVQSVEYRSSGVLFSISPEVRDSSITVQVDQQVSSFIQTTTGVNNSPTLTKRQVTTSVNLADGDVVVIGGLREDKDSGAASGLTFLPDLFKSKSSDKTHSEILLFLQLKRV